MRLEGRTALVIGAGSGVGRGVAHALVEADMRVIAADLDEISAQETCESACGDGEALPYGVDATDRDSLQALAADALPEGVLDLLVVTVGVIDMLPIDEIEDAQWQWAWDLNVMTSVRAVESFLPLLRRSPSSAIVLTGSGSGLQIPEPDPLSALYATTKHALVGYAAVLRQALAPEGIHVVLLVPSGVEGNLAANSTRSRARCLGMAESDVRGEQPVGRTLVPASEIGDLLVSGLSRGSAYVNNRGEAFHQAMREWLQEWQHDTVDSAALPAPPDR